MPPQIFFHIRRIPHMTEIISVRFRPGGKQYYFDPMGDRKSVV